MIKAILNNEVVILNEVLASANIPLEQITMYDGKNYFNPSGAVISPDVPDKPGQYYKWSGTGWIPDNSEKLARSIFSQMEILDACKNIDTENGNTVFMDKLIAVLDNSVEFQLYWNAAPLIDLAHPITMAALGNFTDPEIEQLKLNI